MPLYNLATRRLEDTYPFVTQVSKSSVNPDKWSFADGLGNPVYWFDGTASYAMNAGTASYALNGGSGGTGTPAPPDMAIQFNSGGAPGVFDGDGSFLFDYTLLSLEQGYNVVASGIYSHAQGSDTIASGSYSHAEGYQTTASGDYSHAEGYYSEANGMYSHAEGSYTKTHGSASHTEGSQTIASGSHSHAEGIQTITFGTGSHSEGQYTTASGHYSHAEGEGTLTISPHSHAEGYYTRTFGSHSHAEGGRYNAGIAIGILYVTSSGDASHAEGGGTISRGNFSHAEGIGATSIGEGSHAEGGFANDGFGVYTATSASGNASHAEGAGTNAIGYAAHTEGEYSTAEGASSHAEGSKTRAIGRASHAEGWYTTASADYSHAEGEYTLAGGSGATGYASHTEGSASIVNAYHAHAEGIQTTVVRWGQGSHAEGFQTRADNKDSGTRKGIIANHAEGWYTSASGYGSHAEGISTIASGDWAHAEGTGSVAGHNASHAEGLNTQTGIGYQHVTGRFNILNNIDDYFVIGDGANEANRSNAFGVNASRMYASNSIYFPDLTLASPALTNVVSFDTSTGRIYYQAAGAGTPSNISFYSGSIVLTSNLNSLVITGSGVTAVNNSGQVTMSFTGGGTGTVGPGTDPYLAYFDTTNTVASNTIKYDSGNNRYAAEAKSVAIGDPAYHPSGGPVNIIYSTDVDLTDQDGSNLYVNNIAPKSEQISVESGEREYTLKYINLSADINGACYGVKFDYALILYRTGQRNFITRWDTYNPSTGEPPVYTETGTIKVTFNGIDTETYDTFRYITLNTTIPSVDSLTLYNWGQPRYGFPDSTLNITEDYTYTRPMAISAPLARAPHDETGLGYGFQFGYRIYNDYAGHNDFYWAVTNDVTGYDLYISHTTTLLRYQAYP